jgi:hypothetical protein
VANEWKGAGGKKVKGMRMVMPRSQGVDAGCEGGEEGKEQKFWAARSFYAGDLELEVGQSAP